MIVKVFAKMETKYYFFVLPDSSQILFTERFFWHCLSSSSFCWGGGRRGVQIIYINVAVGDSYFGCPINTCSEVPWSPLICQHTRVWCDQYHVLPLFIPWLQQELDTQFLTVELTRVSPVLKSNKWPFLLGMSAHVSLVIQSVERLCLDRHGVEENTSYFNLSCHEQLTEDLRQEMGRFFFKF